jgi:hypothetical protein
MKLIQTEGQKTYLTKFCQDISKVTLVLMVIAPLVKFEFTNMLTYFIGIWISSIFFITGYLLEGRESQK